MALTARAEPLFLCRRLRVLFLIVKRFSPGLAGVFRNGIASSLWRYSFILLALMQDAEEAKFLDKFLSKMEGRQRGEVYACAQFYA
jgi:hypothetical protein